MPSRISPWAKLSILALPLLCLSSASSPRLKHPSVKSSSFPCHAYLFPGRLDYSLNMLLVHLIQYFFSSACTMSLSLHGHLPRLDWELTEERGMSYFSFSSISRTNSETNSDKERAGLHKRMPFLSISSICPTLIQLLENKQPTSFHAVDKASSFSG